MLYRKTEQVREMKTRGGRTILCGMIRGNLTDKVTLDQRPEGKAGKSKMHRTSGGSVLACVGNSLDPSVTGAI